MKHCPSIGDWRAWLDEALADGETARLTAHLAGCDACQTTLTTLRQSAAFSQQALRSLGAAPDTAATTMAWRQLQTRLADQPASLSWIERIIAMLTPFPSRTARIALSSALASLAIVLGLALTPAGSAALQALQVFRVQTFKAITFEVDAASLPQVGAIHERVPRATPTPKEREEWRQRMEKELAALGITTETTITDKTARAVADLAAARAAAKGTPLLAVTNLPAGLQSAKTTVYVADPTRSTATVDLKTFRQAMRERLKNQPKDKDGSGLDPDRLPGIDPNATSISGSLQTAFSVVQIHGEDKETALIFAQGASPELTLSEGIDIRAIRDALVAMPALSKTTRTQLQSIRDDEWNRTLIIPVPEGTIVRDVAIGGVLGVGGVPGLLLLQKDGQGGVVLWQKNGTLFAVAGNYKQETLLAAANSVR